MTAKTISGSSFWSDLAKDIKSSPRGVGLYNDGDVDYAALRAADTELVVVRRTAAETFSDTVIAQDTAQHFKVVINGNMFKFSSGLTEFSPFSASDTTPIGQVVISGVVVDGSSEPDRFFIAEGTQMFPASPGHTLPPFFLKFGLGDPPLLRAALGGMGPIIVNGLKYGNGNLYGPGVPPGAPSTGNPGTTYEKFLIQRNSNHFVSMIGLGASKGKVGVAIDSKEEIILIFAQDDDASTGITIEDLRDKLAAVGTKTAVFGDGGSSVMLYEEAMSTPVRLAAYVIKQSGRKNKRCTIGLGFK